MSSISLTEGFRFLRPPQGLTNRQRRVFCSRKGGRKAEEKGMKEKNTHKEKNISDIFSFGTVLQSGGGRVDPREIASIY